MNQPPAFCPYCGSPVVEVEDASHGVVETAMVYRCESCEEFVFYNPTPGGSAIVVDDGALLLVEDFRASGEWKLPSGRVELGESMREGVARELAEETGLVVDPEDLVYVHDEAGEPAPEQYMVNVEYAVERAATSGTLSAGSDATDAAFFTPTAFAASENELRASHVDRFGEESLEWLVAMAEAALDGDAGSS